MLEKVTLNYLLGSFDSTNQLKVNVEYNANSKVILYHWMEYEAVKIIKLRNPKKEKELHLVETQCFPGVHKLQSQGPVNPPYNLCLSLVTYSVISIQSCRERAIMHKPLNFLATIILRQILITSR